jgi:sugar lactone lactonase YvrE
MEVELLVDAKAITGEGPVWDERDDCLWWVDIMRGHLHRYDPANDSDTVIEVGKHTGAAIPRRSGGFVLAVTDGFDVLDSDGNISHWLDVEAGDAGTRMNDAKCDSNGRMFAGTMPYEFGEGEGALYRLDGDGSVREVVANITVSNGTDWNLADDTMYYVDSMTHRIDVFDYDSATGSISNRRPLVEVPGDLGAPDGLTVDAEGFIWVAVYGASRVQRYSPAGKLDGEITLPASQITSMAFGGEGYRDLYITSATEDFDEVDFVREPAGGALFRTRPGIAGRAPNIYGG